MVLHSLAFQVYMPATIASFRKSSIAEDEQIV